MAGGRRWWLCCSEASRAASFSYSERFPSRLPERLWLEPWGGDTVSAPPSPPDGDGQAALAVVPPAQQQLLLGVDLLLLALHAPLALPQPLQVEPVLQQLGLQLLALAAQPLRLQEALLLPLLQHALLLALGHAHTHTHTHTHCYVTFTLGEEELLDFIAAVLEGCRGAESGSGRSPPPTENVVITRSYRNAVSTWRGGRKKKTFSSVTLASPLLGSAAGLHGEQSGPVSSLSDPGEAELMLSVLR
ncbi:hypothetical protein EYF80_049346 [Liparis tanakae]|uniref:Uncharacterized protein n=1 Tax=Liparis tanakae TaxID=230148 RepID=A0A4Z2FH15_9TELE|nr:hypothetical protein EYF80_049346 [Liparis tanakae]